MTSSLGMCVREDVTTFAETPNVSHLAVYVSMYDNAVLSLVMKVKSKMYVFSVSTHIPLNLPVNIVSFSSMQISS